MLTSTEVNKNAILTTIALEPQVLASLNTYRSQTGQNLPEFIQNILRNIPLGSEGSEQELAVYALAHVIAEQKVQAWRDELIAVWSELGSETNSTEAFIDYD